jgi:signal transduction histidine kinase
MTRLRNFLPGTVAGQITALVIVAVVLGVGLASSVLLYIFDRDQAGANREALAMARAARIAAIVRETTTRPKGADLTPWRRMRGNGMEVSVVSAADLATTPTSSPVSSLVTAINGALREDWGLEPVRRSSEPGDEDAVFVRVDALTALRFEILPRGGFHNFLLTQIVCALAIVVFIILFLSVYAVRWIIEPLSSIASAARSFGQPDRDYADLDLEGPREIAQAAQALNDMRRRVRTLVNERTQMLVAISHDLRTPLTRLRLRIERLTDTNQRNAMLQDVASINNMLRETLAYLREGGRSEDASLVDLPSILETIAAQFVDVGFDVVYCGPVHHAFSGRAQAIERAVSNVVENATKFGTHIEIGLEVCEDGAAVVKIADDGIGVPAELLDRVLEPFFKVDSARTSEGRTGFGLGLSIARNIANGHGGRIELLNREPHGLSVRMIFGPLKLERLAEIVSAA